MSIGDPKGNPKRKKGNRLLTKIRGIFNCVVCGVSKTEKRRANGQLESPYQLMRRKTCGKEFDGKKWIYSSCYRKFISGKGNPNYKGYMPKCKICGVRIAYRNAVEMEKGHYYKYCRKHAFESLKNGEYHKVITKRNRERMKKMRGIIPEHLKPYLFQKKMSYLFTHKENCKCFIHKRHVASSGKSKNK